MAKITMGRVVKRWWRHLAVKLHVMHEERADPKVQLEQAIQEAREQHRRLTEQAAAVIANQKQTQSRLDRAIAQHDRADRLARHALLLADQESSAGEPDRVARLADAAQASAAKVLALRSEIQELERTLLQATTQAESAKAAVSQNATLLQKRLDEREQLLSDLDRAKMHEAMNATMRLLTTTVGEDVPTFVEVEKKIQARVAKAESMGELMAAQANHSIDARMLEIEQAQESFEAQALLDQMRSELGLRDPRAIEPVRPVLPAPRSIESRREA